MNSTITSAHYVIAPANDELAVVAVTTSSQSLDLTTRTELQKLEAGRYILMICEQNTWYNLSAATGTADETAVSGATQCFLAPANVPVFFIVRNAKFWLNFKGATAGKLRMYVATRVPTEN